MSEFCIRFRVIHINAVHEISLAGNRPAEIRVHFECVSPLSDFDTFASVSRHFEDGENYDYETLRSGDDFIYTGGVTMVDRASIDNLRCGEYLIPLSEVLTNLIREGTYDASEETVAMIADAWFGDRGNTAKVIWPG